MAIVSVGKKHARSPAGENGWDSFGMTGWNQRKAQEMAERREMDNRIRNWSYDVAEYPPSNAFKPTEEEEDRRRQSMAPQYGKAHRGDVAQGDRRRSRRDKNSVLVMPQSSGQYQAPPQIIVLPSPSIDSGSSDSEDSYVVHGGRAAYPATYGSVSATSRTLSAAPYSKPSTMRRSGSGSTTPTTIRSETHNSTASPAILPASTRALAPPGLMSHPQSSYTSQFSVQPEQGATFYPSPQSPPMLGPHQQPRDLGQAPLRPPHQYDSVTSQPWRSAESPPQPPYMSPPHSLSQMSITSGFPRGTRPLDYAHAPATHARFMLSPSMSVMSAPGMASPPGGMSYRGYDQSLGGSMHSWVSPSGR